MNLTEWFNFRTKKFDMLPPAGPSDYMDYVPQDPISQRLYTQCQKDGKTPVQAATLVLKARG